MKRENFQIKANGIIVDTCHAWNSANRRIEDLIRKIAKAENTMYELTDKQSDKDGFNHVRGYRIWSGRNGNVVKFEIEKV